MVDGGGNNNIGFLRDENGMVLTLTSMKVGREVEVRYPATFHVGFIQESKDRVDEINRHLRGRRLRRPAAQHAARVVDLLFPRPGRVHHRGPGLKGTRRPDPIGPDVASGQAVSSRLWGDSGLTDSAVAMRPAPAPPRADRAGSSPIRGPAPGGRRGGARWAMLPGGRTGGTPIAPLPGRGPGHGPHPTPRRNRSCRTTSSASINWRMPSPHAQAALRHTDPERHARTDPRRPPRSSSASPQESEQAHNAQGGFRDRLVNIGKANHMAGRGNGQRSDA